MSAPRPNVPPGEWEEVPPDQVYGDLGGATQGKPPSNSGRNIHTDRAQDVTPRPQTWLWQDRIPFSEVTLLGGDSGTGKSTVAIAIAAHVTRGTALPGEDNPPRDSKNVLFLNAEEDTARVLRPKLEAMGADLSRVHFIDEMIYNDSDEKTTSSLELPRDKIRLNNIAADHRGCLLIIDTLPSFVGEHADMYKDQSARRNVSLPLRRIAINAQAAILCLVHPPKGICRLPEDYFGGSKGGVYGPARAALIVVPDPLNEERRYLVFQKNSYGPRAASLAYRITDATTVVYDEATGNPVPIVVPRVEWIGESGLTARDLLLPDRGVLQSRDIVRAQALLNELLKDGPKSVQEIREAVAAEGIQWGSAVQARTALSIQVEKDPDSFSELEADLDQWALPMRGKSAASLYEVLARIACRLAENQGGRYEDESEAFFIAFIAEATESERKMGKFPTNKGWLSRYLNSPKGQAALSAEGATVEQRRTKEQRFMTAAVLPAPVTPSGPDAVTPDRASDLGKRTPGDSIENAVTGAVTPDRASDLGKRTPGDSIRPGASIPRGTNEPDPAEVEHDQGVTAEDPPPPEVEPAAELDQDPAESEPAPGLPGVEPAAGVPVPGAQRQRAMTEALQRATQGGSARDQKPDCNGTGFHQAPEKAPCRGCEISTCYHNASHEPWHAGCWNERRG